MSTVSPFVAPRLKAQWGRARARELGNALAAFDETNPYRAATGARGGLTVEYNGQFPDEIPLILGDAVHNLRTSLDLLACDLVALNNKPTADVYFPFAKSADKLDHVIKSRHFDLAGEDAVELLRDIKPYTGGNLMLRALHDLDIMDKHQLIIPVHHRSRITKMVSRDPSGARVTIGENCDISLSGGGEILMDGGPPDVDIVTVVQFGDNAPETLRRRPVLETLEQFTQLALGIIQAFETLKIGNRSKYVLTAGQLNYAVIRDTPT